MSFTNNTVVRASAGTGKTRKLVEVYLELLDEGVEPLRIAAVTFTEKAAAEMRDRIRTAIYSRLKDVPAEQNGRWMRILAVLPAAPISTIHGFCSMLLREQGFALGIDPSFSILDEQRTLDLARDAAVETIRAEIRSGNEGAARAFGDFGLDRLVETIVSAEYWLNGLGNDSAWLQARVDDQQQSAGILRAELREHFAKYGDDIERIGVMADELDAKKIKHPFKKRDDAHAILPRMGQIAGVEAARDLAGLIGLASERFRMKKKAADALDFDDLLLGARDLLDKCPEVQRHYQEHFQALLVDEFQDTDEVQAAVIALLAGDPSGKHRFAPRKLMIVGDPKQSIYRFRHARVTAFFRMIQEILDDGGVLEHLQENRRSAPALVEFTNRLSQSMMDGSGKVPLSGSEIDLSYRIRFDATDALIAKSTAPFLGITYVAADSDARAAKGREMEAEAIARLLEKWKSSGVIQSWKAAAMLFRAASNMGLYVDALEQRGIPVYVVQGTNFYQKTEVSDLIALLEFVLHPDDPLLKAIVWSSSLAGLTYEDLLAGRTSPALEGIVRPWIEKRDRATAAEILEDVIRCTNFDVVMMAQRDGPQRVANIGKLIEITRDLSRQGAAALDDVVRRLRDRAQDMAVREAEAQIAGQEDDVVRILTVHQAKGLEFDIVIVPDLAAKSGHNAGDRTFFSDRWGVLCGSAYGLHRKTLPHSLILDAKAQEQDQQYEEEKRLLYVAVTRAKKMLVLGEGFAKHGGPWLQWVQQVFENVQAGAIDRAREGKPVKLRFKGGVSDFVADVVPASMLNIPEQLQLNVNTAMIGGDSVLAQLREIQKSFEEKKIQRPADLEMTPSELSELDGCFRYFHWTRFLGKTEPGSTTAVAWDSMKLGSAVHSIMETGIRPSAAELASLRLSNLAPVFESREWKSLQSVDSEREMPFLVHVQGPGYNCRIRGRMDAVVPESVPRIIDYKYAIWREGSVSAYEIQLMAYCLALMKSLNTDRAIAELWFLKKPMKIIRREYSLIEAERRLSQLISRYVAALETNAWPMAPRSHCDAVACGFREVCFS